MTGDWQAFELWILHDQAAQQREREPEMQLELIPRGVASFASDTESGRICGPRKVPKRSVNCLRRGNPDQRSELHA